MTIDSTMLQEARRQKWTNGIGFFVIGCFFGMLTFFLGLTSQDEGQKALQPQLELDAHGKRTTGQSTGGWESNGRGPIIYTMNYSFEVDGKTYPHSSVVSRDVYQSQPAGSAVQVDYLPNDPKVSRMRLSIAKEKAEENLHVAHWAFVLSWVWPFLMGSFGFLLKPRR